MVSSNPGSSAETLSTGGQADDISILSATKEVRVQAALAALHAGLSASIRQTAARFDVPYSTLRNRLHGRKTRSEGHERQQHLNPVQKQVLLDWCRCQSSLHQPLSRKSVRAKVADLIGKSPSDSWIRRFLGRHKDDIAALESPPSHPGRTHLLNPSTVPTSPVSAHETNSSNCDWDDMQDGSGIEEGDAENEDDSRHAVDDPLTTDGSNTPRAVTDPRTTADGSDVVASPRMMGEDIPLQTPIIEGTAPTLPNPVVSVPPVPEAHRASDVASASHRYATRSRVPQPPQRNSLALALSCSGSSSSSNVSSGHRPRHQLEAENVMLRRQLKATVALYEGACRAFEVERASRQIAEAQARASLARCTLRSIEAEELRRQLSANVPSRLPRKTNSCSRLVAEPEIRVPPEKDEMESVVREAVEAARRHEREATETVRVLEQAASALHKTYSNPLSSYKRKEDLKDIAASLQVGRSGTNQELVARIKAHLMATPSLADDPRFAALYGTGQQPRLVAEPMSTLMPLIAAPPHASSLNAPHLPVSELVIDPRLLQ